jgi:predicted transcriptional regulator
MLQSGRVISGIPEFTTQRVQYSTQRRSVSTVEKQVRAISASYRCIHRFLNTGAVNLETVSANGSDDDVDPQAIREYLAKAGAIEILVALSDGGRRYNELADELFISTSTLYKRLLQGRELNLITAEAEDTDTGVVDVYYPDSIGKAVADRMGNIHLNRVFWQLQERRQQFEELSESVRDWVVAEESTFMEQVRNWQYVDEEDEPPNAEDFYR